MGVSVPLVRKVCFKVIFFPCHISFSTWLISTIWNTRARGEGEGPWLLRQWEQEPAGFLGYNQLHFSRTGGLMLSLALQPSASPLGPKQDQNVVQVFHQSGLSHCLGSDNTHLSLFVKLQQTWRNIRVEKWRDCWKPSPFRTIHPIGIKRSFHFN